MACIVLHGNCPTSTFGFTGWINEVLQNKSIDEFLKELCRLLEKTPNTEFINKNVTQFFDSMWGNNGYMKILHPDSTIIMSIFDFASLRSSELELKLCECFPIEAARCSYKYIIDGEESRVKKILYNSPIPFKQKLFYKFIGEHLIVDVLYGLITAKNTRILKIFEMICHEIDFTRDAYRQVVGDMLSTEFFESMDKEMFRLIINGTFGSSIDDSSKLTSQFLVEINRFYNLSPPEKMKNILLKIAPYSSLITDYESSSYDTICIKPNEEFMLKFLPLMDQKGLIREKMISKMIIMGTGIEFLIQMMDNSGAPINIFDTCQKALAQGNTNTLMMLIRWLVIHAPELIPGRLNIPMSIVNVIIHKNLSLNKIRCILALCGTSLGVGLRFKIHGMIPECKCNDCICSYCTTKMFSSPISLYDQTIMYAALHMKLDDIALLPEHVQARIMGIIDCGSINLYYECKKCDAEFFT